MSEEFKVYNNGSSSLTVEYYGDIVILTQQKSEDGEEEIIALYIDEFKKVFDFVWSKMQENSYE